MNADQELSPDALNQILDNYVVEMGGPSIAEDIKKEWGPLRVTRTELLLIEANEWPRFRELKTLADEVYSRTSHAS